MPASLRLALIGNAVLRVASPAVGILLSTFYVPYLSERYAGLSAAVVAGVLTAAFYVTELTCAPLLGAVGDRRGRRVLLVAGPIVGAAAIGLIGLTTILALLIVARLLEGLSTAATAPAILGRLSDETGEDAALRGRVLSVFEVSTILGSLVGTAGASVLWLALGRGGFAVAAACYVVAALVFSRVGDVAGRTSQVASREGANRGGQDAASQRETRDVRPATWDPPAHSWRDSLRVVSGQRELVSFLPAWLCLAAITGLWFVHALPQMRVVRAGFAGQYLAGRFADSGGGLGLVVLSFALVFSVGILGWGFIGLRRLHELVVMRIGLVAMLGVCAAIWVINHSGDNEPLRLAAIVAYFLLVLLESGFAPAAVAYLARLSGRVSTDRGLIMGLYTVISGGGYLLASLIGIPFAEWGAIDGVLLATVLLALISQALLARLRAGN